jgi:hypothetical protein
MRPAGLFFFPNVSLSDIYKFSLTFLFFSGRRQQMPQRCLLLCLFRVCITQAQTRSKKKNNDTRRFRFLSPRVSQQLFPRLPFLFTLTATLLPLLSSVFSDTFIVHGPLFCWVPVLPLEVCRSSFSPSNRSLACFYSLPVLAFHFSICGMRCHRVPFEMVFVCLDTRPFRTHCQ